MAAAVTAGALLVSAAVVGAAPHAWGVLHAHEEVPVRLPGSFSGLATRSRIMDVSGTQIGVFEFENSQPLAIEAVPDHVIAAVLAVEDQGFEKHKGVNLRALVRAALANFQYTASRQGASTITQQVVKNEFLAGLPRDGRYKILQARYAAMLEKSVPKEKIVERYLNTVFFGNNAYGIQAAAETYFGTKVADLTLAQAAFLAGLVRAPSTYDPIRRPEQARRRFAQVLERLVETSLMTRTEADTTLVEFPIPEKASAVSRQSTSRTYISEMIRDYLLNKSTVLGATYADRYAALYRGGLTITTTIDAADQAKAEKAAREKLPANKTGIQSAVVSLDTVTGAVRALVGGPGFAPGRSEVNLALRRRQTGSSIKIFVLTAALEAGVEGTDLIDGTLPCTLPNPGKPEEPFRITKGVSKPLTTLEEQTWLSINCAYARLAQIVGLNRLPNTVYRMASSAYLRPDTYKIWPYASFSTGANELSAFDMASGAQTIANGGMHHEPFFIEKIEDGTGRVLFQHALNGVQVISKEVADKQVAILKQSLIRGTARRTPLEGDRPSAGKTGTQDENTNAWFVGFTKQLTTAVWVGDPKGYTPMVNIPEFRADGVPRVQGATYPARIWKAYMDAAHAELPVLDWDAPVAPVRNQMRLYLPGLDCIAEVVSGRLPRTLTGAVSTVVPATSVPAATAPPATTVPPVTVPGAVPVTPTTAYRGPVVSVVDPGTTIAPTDTNPLTPVVGVDPQRFLVYDCAKGVPASVRTTVVP
jgi:penicillin-binding protein 1A